MSFTSRVSDLDLSLGIRFKTNVTGKIDDDQKDAYQHLNIVGLVGSIESVRLVV